MESMTTVVTSPAVHHGMRLEEEEAQKEEEEGKPEVLTFDYSWMEEVGGEGIGCFGEFTDDRDVLLKLQDDKTEAETLAKALAEQAKLPSRGAVVVVDGGKPRQPTTLETAACTAYAAALATA